MDSTVIARLPVTLLGLTLLVGCPDAAKTSGTPASPSPTPTPEATATGEPPGAAAAWANLIKHARDHPRAVAGRLKQKEVRASLLAPFEAPTAATLRLIMLTKWLMVFDPKLKRPTALIRPLRLHLKKQTVLDPTTFGPNAPQTVGILVLQDPSFLYDRQLLSTRSGWVSMRRGLASGAFDADLAKRVLDGVQQARAGKWQEAEAILSPAFLSLGKRNSATLNTAGVRAAWGEVERLYGEGAAPDALESAFRAWALHFQSKPSKPPVKTGAPKPDTPATSTPKRKP